VVLLDSVLQTIYDNVLVPSSKVKQFKKNTAAGNV
jgi:hypothetical protein